VAGQAASRCRIRLFQIMNRLAETLIATPCTPAPSPRPPASAEPFDSGETRSWLTSPPAASTTAAPRRSTSSSTRPAADRPRLPQLTHLPTMHPARITQNPAVPTTTHPRRAGLSGREILRARPDHGPGSVSLFVGAPQCTGDLVVVRVQHETDQCDFAGGPAVLVRGEVVQLKPGLI
jgi:hypothetical protein